MVMTVISSSKMGSPYAGTADKQVVQILEVTFLWHNQPLTAITGTGQRENEMIPIITVL
jgi:hypothetical protein